MNSRYILCACLLSLLAAGAQAALAEEPKTQEPKAKIEKSNLPTKAEKSTPAQPKKAVPAKPAKLPLAKYLEPDPGSLGLGCASAKD